MKLILRFLKPHWKLFVITVILLILDVMGALFIPTLAAQMLNLGTSGSSFTQMWHVGVQMAVISVISGICAIIGGYTCAALAARIGKDMRSAIYKKSLKLSIYDFRQFGTASITTRTVSDITTIQTALTSTIQMILLGCMVVVLLLAWGIMRSAAPLFKKLQKLLDRMSTVLLENITGVRVVRAFNLDGLSFFFINLFVVIVYWLCGGEIDTGNLQIGDITAVIEYALMVMFFLMMAQMVILTLPRALECCDRVQAVLDHTPEIRDMVRENPQETNDKKDAVLEFKDVSFRFADAEENTLNHLNFQCRRGETTAIIGGTGSGKSTVASLILRFHDVTEGQISLNGTEIRKMTQSFLRDHLGYVQQKAWLFSGTIASNLRYSNTNAPDDALMHAVDVAQAGEFVRSLPDVLCLPEQ